MRQLLFERSLLISKQGTLQNEEKSQYQYLGKITDSICHFINLHFYVCGSADDSESGTPLNSHQKQKLNNVYQWRSD